MCGSGYPTYPKFLPPTLNFFLQILKLKENSRTKLFCSAILFHLQNLEKKIHSKITIWNGLKQGYIFKNRPFYISFDSELSETQNYAYWYARFSPGTHVFH